MKTKSKIALLCFLLFFQEIFLTPAVGVQLTLSQEQEPENVEHVIFGLNHDDWKVRANTLYSISKLDMQNPLYDESLSKVLFNQKVRKNLVNLLSKENQFLRVFNYFPEWINGEDVGEGYSGYYSYLIQTVAQFKDTTSVKLLVETLGIYSSRVVKESLAEIGEPSVRPLIEALRERRKRVYAASYLREIVGRDNRYAGTLSDSTRQLIKERITELLTSEEPIVRLNAVKVLGQFRETEVIEHLRHISRTDPHFYIKKIDGVEKKIYPISDEAKKQLKLMENQ